MSKTTVLYGLLALATLTNISIPLFQVYQFIFGRWRGDLSFLLFAALGTVPLALIWSTWSSIEREATNYVDPVGFLQIVLVAVYLLITLWAMTILWEAYTFVLRTGNLEGGPIGLALVSVIQVVGLLVAVKPLLN